MAVVYFLCGLAASGKTTYAKRLEAEGGVIRFTLDERMIAKYDYSIFDDEYGPLAQQEKIQIWDEAKVHLNQGRDVVLDWSLWSREARSHWTGKADEEGYTYQLIYFKVPLDSLRQRLSSRNTKAANSTHIHPIPIAELDRFSQIFQPLSSEEMLNLRVIKEDFFEE